MKLKKILESLDGLNENVAELYEKKSDGKFHLSLEDDDAEPLRRAKEHEVGLRQIAEQERDAARAELATAKTRVTELEGSQNSSVQELRESHERAVSKLRIDHATEKAGLESTIRTIFVDDVASKIAKEIAVDDGAAELLAENMKKRLSIEIVNGKPVTRVLDVDGKASVMSPDELKNEYLQSPKYAAILRASDASGGGASGGGQGGGTTKKKLADLGDAERNKLQKENPAEFKRLVDEAKAAASSR